MDTCWVQLLATSSARSTNTATSRRPSSSCSILSDGSQMTRSRLWRWLKASLMEFHMPGCSSLITESIHMLAMVWWNLPQMGAVQKQSAVQQLWESRQRSRVEEFKPPRVKGMISQTRREKQLGLGGEKGNHPCR